MIKHHAFFETLSHLEEKSPEWISVFAGLSVMRLLDRLADVRGPTESLDDHAIDASRRSAELLGSGDSSRAILLRIVESMEKNAPVSSIGSHLLAYGRALDLAGKWALAADVFQTVAESFSARAQPDLVIEASTLLGAASRSAGDWLTSERSYARAEHLAESIGDRKSVLVARMGLANSDMIRGNLRAADDALESVLAEAEALSLEPIKARALHSRASVAHMMGNYQRAVHLAYRSLELTTDATRRERVIADIAAAYAGLGMRHAARSGYSIVAITSPHQWVRWQATINLMELAIAEDDERSFDDYVAQLEPAALDPRLMTYFLFYRATGLRQFGRVGADETFETARSFAEKNQLHQVAFEIEEAMSKPVESLALADNVELTEIAEALERLRDAAAHDSSRWKINAER